MRTEQIYDAFVSAYIEREYSSEMNPDGVFSWTLYTIGIDMNCVEAKSLAYDIAYEGSFVISGLINDGEYNGSE